MAEAWKWSPWMKSGPEKPSLSAAASMTATYSWGRWLVYCISLLAISKMKAPHPVFVAARKKARAVSYERPRTFMAGTVKGPASPRPMAE